MPAQTHSEASSEREKIAACSLMTKATCSHTLRCLTLNGLNFHAYAAYALPHSTDDAARAAQLAKVGYEASDLRFKIGMCARLLTKLAVLQPRDPPLLVDLVPFRAALNSRELRAYVRNGAGRESEG
eukprot:871637-Pleurochrysis_carterae.AAC.1